MSGSDGKSGIPGNTNLPEEGRLAAAQLPTPGQPVSVPPPSIAATTPGVSSSVIRHPGAPTLPDAEPAALTLAIASLANQLFTTPYGALPIEAPNEATLAPGVVQGASPSAFDTAEATEPPHTYGGGQPFGSIPGGPMPSGAVPTGPLPSDLPLGNLSLPMGGVPTGGVPTAGMPTSAMGVGVPSGVGSFTHPPSGDVLGQSYAPFETTPNFDMLEGMPQYGSSARLPTDTRTTIDPTPASNGLAAQAVSPMGDAAPVDPTNVASTTNAGTVAKTSDASYGPEAQTAHAVPGLAFDAPRTGNVPDSRAFDPAAPAASGYTPYRASSGVPAHGGAREIPRHDRALHAQPRFASPSMGAFDPLSVKREFPILREKVNGRDLVWLDNAATTQKPQTVIDRISSFYAHENSNIHRAAHTLAARATDAYESARESVRRFLNAASPREIVFVRGATEGINLVAQSWGRRNVSAGDEIVVSHLEHHANIVPWQMLAKEKGAKIRVAPVDDHGEILMEEYERLLGPKTKLVAFTQVSNALGTVTPAKEMIELAHRHGATVLLDGAQAVSHKRVDVQDLGCDFYVLSGHKVFAPTGIGVVYGRSEILDAMPPWQGGGNMIEDVTFERTIYQPAPARFEAGTGNIADAVGLGAALDWLTRVGLERVEAYEHELLVYGTERLRTVPGLTMIGTAREKAGVLSFVLAGQKTTEVGGMLDKEGIAVRSGHHCAQPILRRFGLEATVRASLAPYNTKDDLDHLVAALKRIQVGHVGMRSSW